MEPRECVACLVLVSRWGLFGLQLPVAVPCEQVDMAASGMDGRVVAARW